MVSFSSSLLVFEFKVILIVKTKTVDELKRVFGAWFSWELCVVIVVLVTDPSSFTFRLVTI